MGWGEIMAVYQFFSHLVNLYSLTGGDDGSMAVYQIISHSAYYMNFLIAVMVILSCYWYLISRRRKLAYRGHFISIILIAASSLIIQLYLSVYAGFVYKNINPDFGRNIAGLIRLPGDMDCLVTFLGLLSVEALMLVIISIANSRRITPEIILFFFLSYMGFLLFPSINVLIDIAGGWFIWCVVPPLLKKPLSWIDMRLKKAVKGLPALIITVVALIAVITAAIFVNKGDMPDPSQVQQVKVFSSAGGQNGLGLYNGLFRTESPYGKTNYVIAVLFEELGSKAGIMLIIMILLIAYGCYFQGMRAEKYWPAVISFLAASFIGLRVMLNTAAATAVSVDISGYRFTVPGAGVPLPFLSYQTVSWIALVVCISLVESVKLSWLFKPAAIRIADADVYNQTQASEEMNEDETNADKANTEETNAEETRPEPVLITSGGPEGGE